MKKVLIISQHFYPEIGSHANRIKNIYKLLKKEKYDVTILTSEPSYPNKNIYKTGNFWDEDSINREADHIHRVRINNRKYSISLWNRLLYFLEIAFRFALFILKDRNQYDCLFVTSPPIFTGFVGLIAKWKYGTRFVLDVRDLWPQSLNGVGVLNARIILCVFGTLEKLLYRKADKIVINSLGFQEYIEKKGGIPKEKLVFIPNGSVKEELIPVKKKSRKLKKIIYAGNLGLAQDTSVIRQLAHLLEKEDIMLTIMGYGINKEQLLAEIKHFKNVAIMNPATKNECMKVISEHDIGLVTLKNKEVFKTVLPGKMIDYMTCGIPIVGAVDGYAKELIEKEGVGIASSTDDPLVILSHIKELLENEALREQMSQRAQQLILTRFNWEKNISLLVESFL